MNKAIVDVNVVNHGTIFVFDLLTEDARQWVTSNVADPMWMGRSIAVEHRYARPLADGMQSDGLVVE